MGRGLIMEEGERESTADIRGRGAPGVMMGNISTGMHGQVSCICV